MPFTTLEQFVLLATVLIAGWLLGRASVPSAGKIKRRAAAQAVRFAAYHRDSEDQLRAARQRATDLTHEIEALRADHSDAERTITRLRGAGPRNALDEAPAPPAATPVEPVETAAIPARPTPPPAPNDRPRDDLTRISGIDPMLAMRLFSLGLVRFEDIEKLSAEDELALEPRLDLPAGYIARKHWRGQAALLRAGSNGADAGGAVVLPAQSDAGTPPTPA